MRIVGFCEGGGGLGVGWLVGREGHRVVREGGGGGCGREGGGERGSGCGREEKRRD